MDFSTILHIPKSNQAYSLNENEINIWLRTKKNDVKSVFLKHCDPFYWYEGFDIKTTSKIEKKYQTEYFDYYLIKLFSKTRRIKYAFLLEDFDNQYYEYGSKEIINVTNLNEKPLDLFNFFNFPFINKEDINKSPDWSKNIVWYQIFMDRFNNVGNKVSLKWNEHENVSNKDIFGGNIKGTIDKLDYLSELGIGGIYFTPIFEAKSVHKYDSIDYFKIDPQFGTNDDFKLLVEKAHQKNIKVMLDIVFNHCGYYHPFFQDVIKNFKESQYYDYFLYYDENPTSLFNDNTPNYHTFAFVKNMPKWNTANPKVQEYLLSVAEYWIKNYDVDGYRLDVSNEVSHHFWKKFCNKCRELKPGFFIIGENWDNSLPWLGNDQFDAVMNYELYFPIVRFFCLDKKQHPIDAEKFKYMINSLIISYPENNLSSMFNLLDCHDTPRIKTKCLENEDLTKLAYLFMFTFTGSPNIYYGGEIGMSGNNDPDNRRCMNFDKVGNDMYQFIKKLIQIRKENINSIKEAHIKWHYTNDNILVYQKNDLLCIINNNNQSKEINIENINGSYIDLFNNKKVVLNTNISLDKYQYYLLKEENN